MRFQGVVKNNSTILIVALMVVLLAGLFWYLHEPTYNWDYEFYDEEQAESKQPYGNQLFYEYLKKLRDDESFTQLDSSLAINLKPYIEEKDTEHNYFMMGRFPLQPDSADQNMLLDFVSAGNNVFIFSSYPRAWLIDEIHSSECLLYWPENTGEYNSYNYLEDSLVTVQLINSSLKKDSGFVFKNRVEGHFEPYRWDYIDPEIFCEYNETFTALGTIEEQVNFFRAGYGRGNIYFHFNPKMFTNYYLTSEEGRQYSDGVLAYMGEGEIIYDMKKWLGNDSWQGDENINRSEGPLRFILSQESLRWGLYTLFGIIGVLMVFAFTRKQRIIPVMHPKENSSMEYVETITELYYQQGGQGHIHKHLTEQFKQFVRDRYRLSGSEADEDYAQRIAQVSGMAEKNVSALVRAMKKGGLHYNVTSELLIEYYKLLNHFYEHCK